MPSVTPRFPKQRNNNIFDQSSQQTGMSHITKTSQTFTSTS